MIYNDTVKKQAGNNNDENSYTGVIELSRKNR